jgi:hypothetical protein
MPYDLAEAAHDLLAQAAAQLGDPPAEDRRQVVETLQHAGERLRSLQPGAVWETGDATLPPQGDVPAAAALLEASHAIVERLREAGPWYDSVEQPEFDALLAESAEGIGQALQGLGRPAA